MVTTSGRQNTFAINAYGGNTLTSASDYANAVDDLFALACAITLMFKARKPFSVPHQIFAIFNTGGYAVAFRRSRARRRQWRLRRHTGMRHGGAERSNNLHSPKIPPAYQQRQLAQKNDAAVSSSPHIQFKTQHCAKALLTRGTMSLDYPAATDDTVFHQQRLGLQITNNRLR